jgi:hypothetical protein
MKTNVFLYIITGDAVTGNTFDAHYTVLIMPKAFKSTAVFTSGLVPYVTVGQCSVQAYCGVMGQLAKILHLHLNQHSPFKER